MGFLDAPSYSRTQANAAFVAKRVHLKSTDMCGSLPTVNTTPLLPSPNILSVVTSTSGGTMAAGIYYYRVSATNGVGESLASIGNRVTTTGSTSSAAIHWPSIPGATGYKVYRSVAAGGAEFAEQLLATIGSGATLTYSDTGGVTPSGALPTSNNTMPTVVTVGAPTLSNPSTGNVQSLTLLDAQAFHTYGAPLAADVNSAVHPAAYYTTGYTSPPPFFVDFNTDATFFTVWGQGGALTLLIDGKLTHAKPFSTTPCLPSNGNNYYHRFDLPAGRKRITLLVNNMKILTVTFPVIATVQATTKRTKLAVLPSDSFGEPTIGDNLGNTNLTTISGTLRGSVVFDGFGFAQLLNFLFPDWDVRPVASGGTGNLNPNAGAGRVKMRDRINDALSQNPHAVWHAMGVNDASYSYAAEYAEARLLYQTVAAHASAPEQIVLQNLWPRQASGQSSGFLSIGDALQDAATIEGLPFVDLNDKLLPYGSTRSTGGVLTASVAANANNFLSSVSFANGDLVKVGRGSVGNADVIKVANSTGSGPYTVTLSGGQMPSSHASAEPVRVYGPSSRTGLGNQGSPSGLGNSDLGVCADATHDTSGWVGSGGVEQRALRFALGIMTTVQNA